MGEPRLLPLRGSRKSRLQDPERHLPKPRPLMLDARQANDLSLRDGDHQPARALAAFSQIFHSGQGAECGVL